MSAYKRIDDCTLLPDQYTDLIRRNKLIEGEKKLMLAVLDDVIRCYLRNVNSNDSKRRQEFVEVKDWIGATSAVGTWRANVFSFENLCAALGLEPRFLLARLRTLTITDLPSRKFRGGPTTSIAVEPPQRKSQAQTRSAQNRQRLNLSTKRLRDRTRPACSRRASIHDRTPSRLRYGASGPLVTERGTDAIRPARP